MNNIILMFEINENQQIVRVDNYKVAENSTNFLYANFKFPKQWQGLKKKALFKYGMESPVEEYLREDDKCKVPSDVIKHSGFKMTIIGEDESNGNVLATTNDIFINVSKNMSSQSVVKQSVRDVISDSLDIERNGETVKIEVPNLYGVKLALNDKTGLLQLIGKDEELLSEVDFPTEKIITNAYYDEASQELVLEFENANPVRIPIKTDFSNYYNKNQIDQLLIQKANTNDVYTKEETQSLIESIIEENFENGMSGEY